MNFISSENAARILADLVAIPSVNPMGRDYDGAMPVERGVTEYLERLFAPYGVAMQRQSYGTTHENLLIALPGRNEGAATLFESHMDTVPAEDWKERAFTPRREGGRLLGRGACDDKGPLTAMALAALDLLESGTTPPHPILFLAAGDEEYAQTGIKHFRAGAWEVGRAVFGEPTKMVPIVQHKGTIRWDITVHGRSAHTARPELGVNAISGAMEVIAALAEQQRALQQEHVSPLITGPTLTVSMIRGGRTRNSVPDECTLAVDFRILPGMALDAARDGVIGALDALNLQITHAEPQLMTPPLQTPPEHAFSQAVLGICRHWLGKGTTLEGVPYGTDASWISDRAPALVLGPGSIVSAHAIDEEIDVAEVVQGAEIYREIMRTDFRES
jgi:acetylornithine deacetylase/succinyl-diaminopimelate desuccinylase-like protein